jgi:hypothetical protein
MKPTELEVISLAREAVTSDATLKELWQGLKAKDLAERQRCFLALQTLAEAYPERMHVHYWAETAAMLDSRSIDDKYIAVALLAGMAAAKGDTLFEPLLDKYFGLLDDNSLIIPKHVAMQSGRVLKAKPSCGQRIIGYLLNIEQTHHTPSRKALIAACALEALDRCFELIEDQGAVIEFAKVYAEAPSPRARKAAREFLKKRGQN